MSSLAIENQKPKKLNLIDLIKNDKENFIYFILQILLAQALIHVVTFSIQILNMKYKISQFNFDNFNISILSHKITIPFQNPDVHKFSRLFSQDTGEFLFKVIFLAFFYKICNEMISFIYKGYIGKYKKTKEDNLQKTTWKKLIIIFTKLIIFLIISDLIREICVEIEKNLDLIYEKPGTAIFVLFTGFFIGGLKKFLNTFDQIAKEKIILEDSCTEKKKKGEDENFKILAWIKWLFNIGYPMLVVSLAILFIRSCLTKIEIFKLLGGFLQIHKTIASIEFVFISNIDNKLLITIFSKLLFDFIFEFIDINNSENFNFPFLEFRDNKNHADDKSDPQLFKRIGFLIIRSIFTSTILHMVLMIEKSFFKSGSMENLNAMLFTFSTTFLLSFLIKLNIQYSNFCKENPDEFIILSATSNVSEKNKLI